MRKFQEEFLMYMKMTKDTRTVEDKVREILSAKFEINPKSITRETRLEDLGADSLDTVEICLDLEDEFDLSNSIEHYQAKKMKTVNDIIKYVQDNY